jgi:hypothetical protein
MDRIFWAEGYDGGNVATAPGFLLDISWAKGEPGPTITYR